MPPGSIVPLQPEDFEEIPEDEDDLLDPTLRQYAGYGSLVKLFGEPVFLPTSKLRRAPSKPTALNRSKSFSRDQKSDLRMKMTELVETEERYVMKLNELVKHIADEFRQSAIMRSAESLSPSDDELEKLFPKSADRILQLNSAFYQELRKIMDSSEDDATKDIEITVNIIRGTSGKFKDPIGCIAMAKVFLEWFPQFTDAYQDYIRASQHFPKLLNSFLEKQSSFKQRVVNRGEQNVRSILIEPVQRLPRYSLLIDQIVNCLPITHPALQLMLRARDIITNICSMDDPLPDKPHITNRLRNLIECWPLDLQPQGRLLTAVDMLELAPPYIRYSGNAIGGTDRSGVFLLFSDVVVILKKKTSNAMNAKDLLREVDKPSAAGLLVSMTNAAGGPGSYELAFAGWHNLADVRFTESMDGDRVWMTSTQDMKGTHSSEYITSTAVTSRCFALQEGYDGRAMKWSDEIVRARIEGRFSETEREDAAWTLRSVRMPDSNLGLYAAVFQEGADQLVEDRREPAMVRIVVDHDKGTKGAPVGHYGVEIVINIKCISGGSRVYVESIGLVGKKYTDEVILDDLLPTLSRRIVQLLCMQFNVSNTRLAPPLVSYHTKILKALTFSNRAEKTRSFLTSSPVKMLTSLLSGVGDGLNENTILSPSKIQQRTHVGSVFPPPNLPGRSNSIQKEAGSILGSWKGRDGDKGRAAGDEDRPENPLMRLEQTFTGYVACLQSRKGNIIGRSLLNRACADELAVNELYNRLIESPYDVEASNDRGVEVIFMSFEKFLRVAWQEQMGPIISMHALDALQQRVSRNVPGNFADFVNYLFSDMAPQNRRAFTALIKLLADLLDGCGNDGDRGALTLAFAELLVNEGSAHGYINLLDRLVEDCDRIFEEIGFGSSLHLAHYSAYEHSTIRGGKSQTGSVTSNTSSLRRKFGFDTLLRQNSKHDDSRSSVWRNLSKHGRHPATGDVTGYGSLKGSIGRSRSIESREGGPNKLQRRPGSRDRPPVSGAFDDINQRPSSSQRLETIGEPENEPQQQEIPRPKTKKKRRSSLSDLKSLMSQVTLEDPTLMPLPLNKQTSEKFNLSPQPASPSRIPISPGINNTLRAANLRQKENVQDLFSTPATVSPSSVDSRKSSHKKTMSASQIPTLRPSRSGMETPSRIPASPVRTGTLGATASGKLRLQSPQKLRERLQTEKKAVEEQDAYLKSELSRIAEDMARVNSSLPRPASMMGGGVHGNFGASNTSSLSSSTNNSIELRLLTARVSQLEAQLASQTTENLARQHKFIEDMDATLKAQEQKVKAIDQLYKEATAENELLYEKFNSELGKMVKALRAKKGSEEREDVVLKMREQVDEIARLKKDNQRLKREMTSLRSFIRGAPTSGNGSIGSAIQGEFGGTLEFSK